LGRRADRHPRPAALYGRLEIAIGAFGIVSPAVLGLARHAYVGAAAALGAGSLGSLGLPFGLAALVLLVPPPLLGGALPGLPRSRDGLHTVALVLLGCTAFASLLDEIAWTRVLVMVVGGSTYAFTLVLVVFLLGIGLGSALVARPSTERAVTAASAGLAQGVTAAGAAGLFVFFSWLPLYILAVFQIDGLGPTARLLLMGLAVGAVVLVPALGMGMTFPLLTDLVAQPGEARARDVGVAYALNTAGSILGAALTGFVLVVALGT